MDRQDLVLLGHFPVTMDQAVEDSKGEEIIRTEGAGNQRTDRNQNTQSQVVLPGCWLRQNWGDDSYIIQRQMRVSGNFLKRF